MIMLIIYLFWVFQIVIQRNVIMHIHTVCIYCIYVQCTSSNRNIIPNGQNAN